MDLFICFKPNKYTDRDILEEEIEQLLNCKGEITGGVGTEGINIDIELYNRIEIDELNKLLKQIYCIGMPENSYVMIDGKKKVYLKDIVS